MVMKKSNIKGIDFEVTDDEDTVGNDEYSRGIKKIASYSGVTRIMKCDGKCGKFDEIVNIYVYPKGIRSEADYKAAGSPVIDGFTDENSISKKNVKNENVAYRHKKKSKPVRRMTTPKRGNKSKRNK
jgi:hypothetical protein